MTDADLTAAFALATHDPTCACAPDRLRAWSSRAVPDGLTPLGALDSGPAAIRRHGYDRYPDGTGYWSPDAAVAPHYYPYHDSEYWRCPACGALFGAYTERGGHVPEARVRWLRPDLVRWDE